MKGVQHTGLYFEAFFHPLWLNYISERSTTVAKAYGIQVRYHWEHIGNKRKNETRIFLKTPPSREKKKE